MKQLRPMDHNHIPKLIPRGMKHFSTHQAGNLLNVMKLHLSTARFQQRAVDLNNKSPEGGSDVCSSSSDVLPLREMVRAVGRVC